MNPVAAPDGALTYSETDLTKFFPEPLNAITSCVFIAVAAYWLLKLNWFSKNFLFLTVAAYLLLIGSIGGTMYHALRQYPVFIIMDWLPILLLCILGSAYFWSKLVKSSMFAVGIILIFFFVQLFINRYADGLHSDWEININYGIMAIMVLIPVLIYLIKARFFGAHYVIMALFFFILALFFRIADSWQLFSVGTHFLWHVFGAVATHSMLLFIYRVHHRKVHAFRMQSLWKTVL